MKSIYIAVFLASLFVASLIVSIEASNHTVEIWSSLIAGFAFGVSLIKLPLIIAWFKNGSRENIR